MTLDERLAAASATIGEMAEAGITQRLEQLRAAHRGQTDLDRARYGAESDSAELDWAAYELAGQHEAAGDLAAAARWYGLAAASDLGDAALRLGRVLDRHADRHAGQRTGAAPSGTAAEREELALVSEAARWYIEAYSAGHLEAVGYLDDMISRHDIRRPRSRPRDAEPEAAGATAGAACARGGLDAVIEATDLAGATAHFQRCTPCQQEFVQRGGLLASWDVPAAPRPTVGPMRHAAGARR